MGKDQVSLAKERELYLDISAGVPEFLVTPLLMGPVCLLSQGRFEEPVRPCIGVSTNIFFENIINLGLHKHTVNKHRNIQKRKPNNINKP